MEEDAGGGGQIKSINWFTLCWVLLSACQLGDIEMHK